MSITSSDVLYSLVGTFSGCRWTPSKKALCIANSTTISHWESDLLVIHDTGWVDEVEIKISVSDFRAELKKKAIKHESLVRGYQEAKFYLFPASTRPELEFIRMEKGVHIYKNPTLVRRFWFAMPKEVLAKVEGDIPPWAGILSIGEQYKGWPYHYVRVERNPKQLPSRKATDADRIAAYQSIYFRAWKRKADTWEASNA